MAITNRKAYLQYCIVSDINYPEFLLILEFGKDAVSGSEAVPRIIQIRIDNFLSRNSEFGCVWRHRKTRTNIQRN